MTGFDIPSLGGLGLRQVHGDLLRAMSSTAGRPQDPERVGPGPTVRPERLHPERTGADGPGFAGVLADSLDQVQALQDDAKDKVRGLALGEDVGLHDVMIAANKSEVAFNLLLEVRNKLVDAWDKLSRSVM